MTRIGQVWGWQGQGPSLNQLKPNLELQPNIVLCPIFFRFPNCVILTLIAGFSRVSMACLLTHWTIAEAPLMSCLFPQFWLWIFTNFSKNLTLLHQHSVIIRCCASRRSNLRPHSNRVLSRPRENIYHQTRGCCCWRWRDWVHIIHVLSFHVHRIISNDSSNCFILEAYRYCHNSKSF